MTIKKLLSVLIFLTVSCNSRGDYVQPPTEPQPSVEKPAQTNPIVPTSLVPEDQPAPPPIELVMTRPETPNLYCKSSTIQSLSTNKPPEPFLYQPFAASFTAEIWTAQMDHDSPNYTQNGVLSTLGEINHFDRVETGLAGGTQAYATSGQKWFSANVSYFSLKKIGYSIFAYQSPSFETYQYYDGHDGHDFAVSGDALAAGDGQIVFIGTYDNSLGRVIEIYHSQGYLTRYAHLAGFGQDLEVGDSVKAGDVIGTIGGSAVINGSLIDGYWGVHLHFSVFRWNGDSWNVVDPFGWDPWAGPDEDQRLEKQLEDPLAACNGEVSYNLWKDNWPHPITMANANVAFNPINDRYVGGWLGNNDGMPTDPTGRIAYVSGGEIHVYNLEGGEDIQITYSGDNYRPAWSFDGQFLLFIHGSGSSASAVILNSDYQEVSAFPAASAIWASNSYAIYWLDGERSTIYTSDMFGKDPLVYYANLPDPAEENWEDFSVGPNGGLDISVVTNGWEGRFRSLQEGDWQLFLDEYSGPMFEDQPTDNCLFSLDQSPVNGYLAFVVETSCLGWAPGTSQVYVSGPLEGFLNTYGVEPDWSPDENFIVYRYMDFQEGMPGLQFIGLALFDLRSASESLLIPDPDAQQPVWGP